MRVVQVFTALSTALSSIAHNVRRLGEAAAYNTRYAGYLRSNLHYTFCGVTAAVAPNRMLCRRYLSYSYFLPLSESFVQNERH